MRSELSPDMANFFALSQWESYCNTVYMEDINRLVYAKSLQSYLVLCDPKKYGPPGSSVHGILQARILE